MDLLCYGLQDGNKSIPTLQSVSRPQAYDSDTILTSTILADFHTILMRAPTLAEGRGAADASIETTSVFVVQSEDSYVQAVRLPRGRRSSDESRRRRGRHVDIGDESRRDVEIPSGDPIGTGARAPSGPARAPQVPDTIPWASIEIGTSGYFTRDGTRGDRFGDDFPWMASRMARTPLPGGNRAQPPREIIRAVIGDEHVERVLARA